MSETRRQVLQLVQDGKITADQAAELLSAMEGDDIVTLPERDDVFIGEVIEPTAPPDMQQFRRFWQLPFFIALGLLLLSGLGLRSLYQSSEGIITFWFVCVWSLFMLMFFLTGLAFLSRHAPWIHIRVRKAAGRRIAISLPLPLRLASWVLNLARGFVHEDEQNKLDMASHVIAAVHQNFGEYGAEPLIIHVDNDGGDQVDIYIG